MSRFIQKVWNALPETGRERLLRAIARIGQVFGHAVPDANVPAQFSEPDLGVPDTLTDFTGHTFSFADARYVYRLYVPNAPLAKPMPLLVMLHGCNQDAADFAKGTGMNTWAAPAHCMVLYPEQRSEVNAMRCWSWFDVAHQTRGLGEPAMIAALIRHVLQTQNVDATRVYIAGLSAGGAMAAVVADEYPELFAALGVHSGLPVHTAKNMVSAFSVMRQGAKQRVGASAPVASLPTVVFHGTADKTVHPANGEYIVNDALSAWAHTGLALQKIQCTEVGGAGAGDASTRSAQRARYCSAEGKPFVESWLVNGAPHAWSGGNAAGSFTDPQGPCASRAMLSFFLQHQQVAKASA